MREELEAVLKSPDPARTSPFQKLKVVLTLEDIHRQTGLDTSNLPVEPAIYRWRHSLPRRKPLSPHGQSNCQQ